MYLVLFIATLCLLGIYIKDTKYVNYLHHCIDDLELANKHLREGNNLLKGLANEQNQSMNEMKAGMYEQAYVGFQNVKDEIERLSNKEELNTISSIDND